ncbi:MAG TPA: hypothetical protein VG649_17670 [Candidatus Angelobacter sp.]|nr:hypothetical protein [Candidatus Angelobacter sp.]
MTTENLNRYLQSYLLLFLAVCLVPSSLTGQQTTHPSVQRDEKATNVLRNAVRAAGSTDILDFVRDFKGSGKITYYWAGEEVQGDVTVLARGTRQFRLDASLPEGVRSLTVNGGDGSLKEASGEVKPLPSHNTENFGSVTFPAAALAEALRDSSFGVYYIGSETKEDHQVDHIRLQKTFNNDPQGLLSRLTRKDFFIDASTFQVVSTLDMLHPERQSGVDYPHEVQFSDYRQVEGILVPFAITEITSGQRTFTIQLNQFTANTGLFDRDFQIHP